jgi:hypothetical protein
MRTTLSIDDDVLAAAKVLAARERSSVGEVVSRLARQALIPTMRRSSTRNGVLLLPRREEAASVTLELVNSLRDETA